jgi:hypothetical protein
MHEKTEFSLRFTWLNSIMTPFRLAVLKNIFEKSTDFLNMGISI